VAEVALRTNASAAKEIRRPSWLAPIGRLCLRISQKVTVPQTTAKSPIIRRTMA
jgi:hypothetical protein